MSAGGKVLIIGGGPAGLTAASELLDTGFTPVVFEADRQVGGISRTVEHQGYRFDIGGHRFFTKVAAVGKFWREALGEEFLLRDRLSRIHYKDHFFDYPLKPINAFFGLGPLESLRIAGSYLLARMFPAADERTFEQWVSNRFGKRLFGIFFKTYTEKVWGIPCSEIGADWAAQRIKNLDLTAALKNALLGSSRRDGRIITTLIDQFEYPRFGPGQLWEAVQARLESRGVPVQLEHRVTEVRLDAGRVGSLLVRGPDGRQATVQGDFVLSSMPIRDLMNAIRPAPPVAVLAAANRLRYRDFLTVGLIIDKAELFPDNWIYIHSPRVKVGRIQNFKNWSPWMVPDPARTALGLEYFVQEDDELWSAPDAELISLAADECASLGLISRSDVRGGCVIRMPKAYPVYDSVYREALDTVRGWLAGIPNLQLMGRNGLHRYNNQDHSMLTAMYAVRNIAGASHDVWAVNTEESYHEEIRSGDQTSIGGGDRAVPRRVARDPGVALIRDAFARYDPVALGAAVGLTGGVGLLLATAILLLEGGDQVGTNLALLSVYLFGYQVSWPGAFVGLLEATLGGFVFGFALARLINLVVDYHLRKLWRRITLRQALDVARRE